MASLPLTTLGTLTASGAIGGSTLWIGSDGAAGSNYFAGTIGALAYHNIGLSDQDVVRASNALLGMVLARGAIVP